MPAVPCQAPDQGNLPGVALFDFDAPALCEQVQDALFPIAPSVLLDAQKDAVALQFSA